MHQVEGTRKPLESFPYRRSSPFRGKSPVRLPWPVATPIVLLPRQLERQRLGVFPGIRCEPNKIWCIPSVREKILGHEDGAPKRSSSTTTMLRSPARAAVTVLQDSSASTSSTVSAPPTPVHHGAGSSSSVSSRLSLLDTCHRKIRFFGELVAKARRKEKDAGTTEDPKLYLEEAALERQLPELDLRMLVDLPPGLDYNEWLASHTLALFDHINLVYGTISEYCTMTGCPDMTGPGLRTYLWFDEKGKKTRVAAPQYIDYVMTFTQRTVSDETIFPTKYANEFPSSFESIVRNGDPRGLRGCPIG
ncbi:hypothetical protein KM043_016161 [Ampulex compressa]|nr:hypothetical protein KM043_016161 [Ampulex compressa]